VRTADSPTRGIENCAAGAAEEAGTGTGTGATAEAGAGATEFLADRTVGRLARWLRLLGYDTVWDGDSGPPRLLARAEKEGRVLLTRDTLLVERRAVHKGRVRAVLVRCDHLAGQLQQLRTEEGLHQVGPARCLVCNGEVRSLGVDEVRRRVPPFVAATQSVFTYCPHCDRVTWPATHWDDMCRRMREVGFADVGTPHA
jgi:uncharacterized protein